MELDSSIPRSGTDTVLFDPRIYSIDAVKKAAYKFTDRCSLLITMSESAQHIEVHLSYKPDTAIETKHALIEQLNNEVLDQDLREKIFRETESVRNLILAQAFSKTSLLDDGL